LPRRDSSRRLGSLQQTPSRDSGHTTSEAVGAPVGWDFFRLEEELSELFGRRVDLGTKRSLKPWVKRNVLRDARVIYAA
jgi:hypothetical protein